MSTITHVKGREIIDSRGNPTVEVEVEVEGQWMGRASVPSGASTGEHEALELRDKDPARFLGKGVLKAVENIQKIIAPVLIGQDVTNQTEIDHILLDLDGTEGKKKLGANALLGVSLASARAATTFLDIPLYRYIGGFHSQILPIPMANIINGGAHANNSIDFQEFMIMPLGAESFRHAIRIIAEIFHNLKKLLSDSKYSTAVGDEGGFAPNLKSNEEAIEMVLKSIEKAGYRPGETVFIALDPAMSELYSKEKGIYTFHKSNGKQFSSAEMASYWETWTQKYPIISIEDGMAEDDWDGWKELTDRISSKVQLVGDDLFVTNTKRLSEGIKREIANSILIKVNQIGTLTETYEAVSMAQRAGYTAVISHRSGETEDSFISDLAVGLETGQIKTGSISRSDRVAKYNQLLRIEEELGDCAEYGGKNSSSFRQIS